MPVEQPEVVMERAPAVRVGDGDMELWTRKYQALKKKCQDYQRMNDMLFSRAKEIHKVIEKAEAETRYLVKKLEQYEEVDFPRCLPSVRAEEEGLKVPSLYHPHMPNQALMSAAASRVQVEVDRLLSRDSDSPVETGPRQIPVDSPRSQFHTVDRSPTHSGTTSTTVSQGPPRLIPVPSSSPVSIPDRSPLGPPKPKRLRKTFKAIPEKLKPSLKGAAAAKRRRGDIDPNAPKKPSNAFFWFCQARRAELQEQFKGEGTTGQHDLTKALAKLWGETTAEDKKPFYEQYTLDKARYDQEMEEYVRQKQSSVPPSPSLTNQIAASDNASIYSVTVNAPEV